MDRRESVVAGQPSSTLGRAVVTPDCPVDPAPRSNLRSRFGATVASAIAVAAVTVYVGLGLYTELQLIGRKPLPGSLLEDYGFYWRAFIDATNGRDPYAIRNIGPAYLYPPPALFIVGLFAPFAIPLPRAAAYITVNLLLLALLVWGISRRYGYGFQRTWWWYPLAFGFGPVLEDLHVGQMNIVTEFGTFLLLAFDGVSALGSLAPLIAGFGLAVGIVTKVTPAAYIVYLVATRSWRTLIGSVAWLVVMLVASALAFGARHLLTYVDVLNGLTTVFLPGDGNTQGLTSVLNYYHWLSPQQAQPFEGKLRMILAGTALLCGATSLVLPQKMHPDEKPPLGEGAPLPRPRAGLLFATLGIIATIAPNFMWYHHWSLLLLPLFIWIAESRFNPAIVAWVFVGMTVVQVDRFGLGRGLYSQAFAYLSLLIMVAQQGVGSWKNVRDPHARARVFATARVAWSWLRDRVLPPESGEPQPVPDPVASVTPAFRTADLDERLTRRETASTGASTSLLATLLVIASISLGAAIRVYGALGAGQVADVANYRNHVEVLRLGRSVYHESDVYPYFPGWLDLEWGAWLLSLRIGVPFWQVIRLEIVAMDVLTCFALWWTATRLHSPERGRWCAALYALSPIAILISGFHGQFEAIPTLFSVLALGLLAPSPAAGASGLLVGLATAIKPFPAVLIPVFLRARKLSWIHRGTIAASAGLALLIVIGASVGTDAPAAVRSVITYSGVDDQGLAGVLRSLWLYKTGSIHLPGELGAELRAISRFVALAMMAVTLLLTWRRPVARACAAVLLAFLLTYSGISTQYLQWPVAWLLLADLPLSWAIVYSIATATGAIGFYLVFWPQIILVPASQGGPQFAVGYLAGEIVAWLGVAVTYAATIGRPRNIGKGQLANAWFVLVLVTGIAAAVAVVPLVSRVAWFIGELGKAHH